MTSVPSLIIILLTLVQSACATLLCATYPPSNDLPLLRRSLSAAVGVPETRLESLQEPTPAFHAYCFRFVTAAGGYDGSVNGQLRAAGEVVLLGSNGGHSAIVDVGEVGPDVAAWGANPAPVQALIGGQFTTTTLAIVVVVGAAVVALVVITCVLCRRKRQSRKYPHLRRQTDDEESEDTINVSVLDLATKSIHPLQDTAAFPVSNIRAVLPLFAISAQTVDELESEGYTTMEALQALSGDQRIRLLDKIDPPLDERQRLEDAILSFAA